MTKWIVITGGVLSGLGKGVVSASIGKLFKGKRVIPVKCDGYLNIDPGTMNPIEHGEVFVLDDGGEVDLDFGHYERFLDIDCKFEWNLTSGKVFQSVIEKERKGNYLGKTVQMIPHVTDEIKDRFYKIAEKEKADVMLIEIGGTVGDIENMLFLEAARQLKHEVGKNNILYVHLTHIPKLANVGEQKTKPTQTSNKILRETGILPNIIVGRSSEPLSEKTKEKISLFCDVEKNAVISDPDTETVYELPLIFEKEGLSTLIQDKLEIELQPLENWRRLIQNLKNPEQEIKVAICGKYTELHDSYISIIESLKHVTAHNKIKTDLKWIETTSVKDEEVCNLLNEIDGIIIPGGFGQRGAEGKIKIIRYARENNIPFLGLCYGLQLAVIEYARNVCKIQDANSTEIDKETKNKVIAIMEEQKKVKNKGATMRLGSQKAAIKENSIISKLYGSSEAYERHRHRYEVNPNYHKVLQENGLILSGLSPDKQLVEFIELGNHPYFIATQAHPELKSRLENPAPLFLGFVKAVQERRYHNP